jgi:hypothetical protein
MKEKMNMIERREGFFIFIVDVRKKKKKNMVICLFILPFLWNFSMLNVFFKNSLTLK